MMLLFLLIIIIVCTLGIYTSKWLKAKQIKNARRLTVRVDITFKRLMQQDDVKSRRSAL